MFSSERGFSAWKGVRWGVTAAALVVFGLMLKRPAALAQPLPAPAAREYSEHFQTKWNDLEQAHQRGEATEARFTADEISSVLDYSGQPGQLSFSGDQVIGQFVANVHGKNVYVTIAGKLGAANGYLTFEPAELKIGDLPVPISILKPRLESKLAEPEIRSRLKLPEYVAGLRIEDSQLVVIEK
jgi:hypothetical protein